MALRRPGPILSAVLQGREPAAIVETPMAAFARTAVEGDDYAMLAAEFPDSSF